MATAHIYFRVPNLGRCADGPRTQRVNVVQGCITTIHQHQPTNNNLSFVTFFKQIFSGFDFVINILLRLLGGFLHTSYLFYINLLLVSFV